MILPLLLCLQLSASAESVAPGTSLATSVPISLRASPPAVRPAAPLPLPEPVEHAPWDGLRVLHVPVDGLRKVQIAVVLHQGSVALCGEPAPACEALGDLLGVATGRLASDALEERLVLLDAELTGDVGLRDTTLRLAAPPEALDEGLALLREALLTPAFPKQELGLLKRDTLLAWRSLWPTDPNAIARLALDHGWFPAEHPFGARPDLAGWQALKPADLEATHARLLQSAPVTVLVVGDVSWEDLEPRLKKALDGVGRPGARPEPVPFTPPGQTRVVAVDLPGQEQVTLRLRVAAPVSASAERPSFQVAHFALGGTFLSRINENLREDKGWTYGAGARYHAQPTRGSWDLGVDLAAENLAAAVREIEAEIAGMVKDGPTEAELSAARADQVQTWNERLATSDSARAFYLGMLDQDDTLPAARARLDAVAGLSPEAVRDAAAAVLGADAARLWVVVGDRSRLEPQLQALGWTAEWLSPDQAVLGDF